MALTETMFAGLTVSPVQERSQFFNLLIYGESGVGKTTLAGSCDAVAAMRPVLNIDIEGGTESLRHSYPDVETVRVKTWKEVQGVYNELAEGTHKYRTVLLDSLTEIQKFNMYNIMTDLAQKRPDLDPDVPGMREWGKNLEQIRRMVRAFRDLEMHTIFTALVREEKNQKTGLTTMQPSLSGKMAGEVAAFLDVVVYYYVKQIGDGTEAEFKRLLLTQKTDTQVAKDRSGKLPMVMESPNMQMIFDYMTGKKKLEPTNEIEPTKTEEQ